MADIVQSFFVVKNIFNYIKISYFNMDVSSVNIFNRPTALHGPRKYTELANDVPNRVHKELYNAAIEKLIDDLDNILMSMTLYRRTIMLIGQTLSYQ